MRNNVGAAMISSAKLYRVRVNTDEGTQIAFVPFDRFIIGSLPSLPVVVNDTSVAKKHLVVSAVNNEIFLTDQNTMSGTKVNGRPIPSNVPFRYTAGDRIVVGRVEYSLQIHLFEQVIEGLAPAKKTPDETAELEAERILFEARNEAAEIVRVAKQEAEKKIQGLLLETEKKSLEILKSREEKIQFAIRDAHVEAEKILAEARESALKLQHEASIRAAQERGVEASQILAEASLEAAKIKEDAHAAAQEGLKNLYQQASERAEASVRARETEADSIIERARTLAQEIKVSAQEEANRFLQQALNQVHEIRAKAVAEGEALLAEARAKRDRQIETLDLENARMIESARALAVSFTEQAQKEIENLKIEGMKEVEAQKKEAKDLLAKAEQDIRNRRAQVEAEIAQMRADEIKRIEDRWEQLLSGFVKNLQQPQQSLLPDAPKEASRWAKVLAFARPRKAG